MSFRYQLYSEYFTAKNCRWMLAVLLIALTGLPACTSLGDKTLPDFTTMPELAAWPAAPATPRIALIATISRPGDLGIEKGFLARLGDLVFGGEPQKLVRPMAVLVVGQQMYVSDPGARGVHLLDYGSGRYRLIKRVDNQPLPSPVALTEMENGVIYVSDSQLAKVYRFSDDDPVAREVELEGSLQQPTGMVYDRSRRRLYVVDTASHALKVFGRVGQLVEIIGKRGKGKAEFNYPTLLAASERGRLLVTDSLNFRIQQFAPSGKYSGHFGQAGDATGKMGRPKGVAVDRDGHIYVVDGSFHNVQVFDSKGQLLMYFGSQGAAPGEFWLPVGISITRDNVIFVADSRNQRIQVFRYIGSQS